MALLSKYITGYPTKMTLLLSFYYLYVPKKIQEKINLGKNPFKFPYFVFFNIGSYSQYFTLKISSLDCTKNPVESLLSIFAKREVYFFMN